MKIRFILITFPLLIVFQVFFCNKVIESCSSQFIERNIHDLPSRRVGLLLGTSKFLKNGSINLYYKYRVAGAIKLFRSGKVKIVIVSGDNSSKNYDEPSMMRSDLIKGGIPASRIFCDYAGFSTIDSVLRAKLIFDAKEIIVISQKFHVERAIYIGNRSGMQVVGYAVQDVPQRYDKNMGLRELLARVKAVAEICLFQKSPRFLGDKISLNVL